ncbi:DsbA family protein [Hyphococcus flavus]|uniref:DsbA family protein n=1 Tax=Hyphococcus flavus TaxID=1866326 RepID=A0AAE9ZGE5_9PROT|nr:DsbA family protein [Hyphococcus flavus]WDI32282.1 DsbA family protein [Hyphococcus flavus]
MSVTFSALRRLPLSSFVAGALALILAACGGANSSEDVSSEGTTGDNSSKEDVVIAGTGALSDMVLGSADAPVTVIEYASTTCPHCATFHATVFPAIKEKYVDTGKVRFVFREFPTAPANLAIASSMLARCATDKGGIDAYFLVLDALFKTQRTWIGSATPRVELLKIASQAGMSEADFDACVQREELLEFLNENINEAVDKYEINATPAFVVNGETRSFASVESFSEALDKAIEEAGE